MKFSLSIFILLNLNRGDVDGYNFTCTSERETLTQRNFAKYPDWYKWVKWPNAIVKYELHSSLTSDDIIEVRKAFDEYHQKTCIRFQERLSGEAAYVSIENDPTTCGLANMCMLGGYQFARFGGNCRSAAVMIHELGHTLCFGHEQTREDRDNFLSFPCGNAGTKDVGFDTLGLFYDYKSSMHYACTDCIVPKMSDVSKEMCNNDVLSVLDVDKLNSFYDCAGCLGYRFRPVLKLTTAERDDLLPAGISVNGEELYVCRAYHNGDITPGTGSINNRGCYVSMHQQEHYHIVSEFLTKGKAGTRLVWSVKPWYDVIPSNAIAGGRTRVGETLFIARATLTLQGQSATVIGKVYAGRPGVAFIPLDGKEHQVSSFEFLQCF